MTVGSRQSAEADRPGVSVVVPFLGDWTAARRLREQLERLELGQADEVIVADNTADGVAVASLRGPATVVRAVRERSSYHARNAGARVAAADWLLFLDADCAPAPDLLDRYFESVPGSAVGMLGGSIIEHPDHGALLARYAISRHFYCGARGMQRDSRYAPTGNLLVRRSAFEQVGGFVEGIRSAGDVDLCWRIQAAGWTMQRRPEARVAHRHREDLPSFLRMLARYSAGAGWLNRRYPGASPRWPLSAYEVARSARDAARLAFAGDREEAAFRLVDGLGLIAHNVGYRCSNESHRA